MLSLNDILKDHVKIEGNQLRNKGLTIEFDLDPDMPEIYHDLVSGGHATIALYAMLAELTGEQSDAKIVDRSVTKVRYSTLFVDGMQVIIIEHDGKVIPYDKLAALNGQLDRIYRTKETINPTGRSGNRRAAIKITEYGGRIYLQNHPGWKYAVDTTVEIPTGRHL